jgi:thiamine monophosphate synthase
MRLPRVYPILDTESLDRRGIALETAAAAFLDGGAGILQIRHKQHRSRSVLDVARTWRAVPGGRSADRMTRISRCCWKRGCVGQ